jgi:hypothetical protein
MACVNLGIWVGLRGVLVDVRQALSVSRLGSARAGLEGGPRALQRPFCAFCAGGSPVTCGLSGPAGPSRRCVQREKFAFESK